MTKKEQISVTISPDGQVEVHLEGFGKKCDDYIKILKDVLNAQVKEKKFTSEYYSETVDTEVKNRSKY